MKKAFWNALDNLIVGALIAVTVVFPLLISVIAIAVIAR